LYSNATTIAGYIGYDAMGHRAWTQFLGQPSTFFIYDGDTVLGEVQNPNNTTSSVTAIYTWGAAGLVSERLPATSQSLWYHFGPQGETRQLTNSAGAVADTYLYSSYGVPISATGTDSNPFRY